MLQNLSIPCRAWHFSLFHNSRYSSFSYFACILVEFFFCFSPLFIATSFGLLLLYFCFILLLFLCSNSTLFNFPSNFPVRLPQIEIFLSSSFFYSSALQRLGLQPVPSLCLPSSSGSFLFVSVLIVLNFCSLRLVLRFFLLYFYLFIQIPLHPIFLPDFHKSEI